MKIDFGYGKDIESLEIDDRNLLSVLKSNNIEHKMTGDDAVLYALEHPIGTEQLHNLVGIDKKIVIVTSDITRPLPSWVIMPHLLDELYKGGAKPENITVVLALGSHRQHTKEEKIHLVGERCYNEVRVIDSDVDSCINVGYTENGTPCSFDKNVVNADIRICLGNIEFHYFAGYSGGYKAFMPGVSTTDAIQANHSLMVDNRAVAGNIESNPVRKDIDEAGGILGCDFIVNAVLDENKNIVYCVAGDPIAAHRDGCKYLDKMYLKPIKQKADIVIVSQGGAPKDANLYQTQKALDNAKHAVKDGGCIILIGECNEGLGSDKFKEWLINANKSGDMIDRVKSKFELGGHKAAAIAMILEYADIYLVSNMDPNFVKSIFLKPYSDVKGAYEDALKVYGSNASVIAMPYGGSTLPYLIK